MTIHPFQVPQTDVRHHPLGEDLLSRVKSAFSTRHVDLRLARQLVIEGRAPRAGDLVLARVSRVGHHKRIERPDGRRAHLFAGDLVLVAYGNRYAPDQFCAVVPDDLSPCELVAAGGVAARVISCHQKMTAATRLEPLGLLADVSGKVLNLRQFALRPVAREPQCPVMAVVGTAMNAGKTTALSRLALGLGRAGLRVAASKVTGTGAGGDFWMMVDAGAATVHDFSDLGFVSTCGLETRELRKLLCELISLAAASQPDVILLELADGLLQPETRKLLAEREFHRRVDGVLFAAVDAMGAVAGAQRLQAAGLPLKAVTGSFTAAPLAVEETVVEVSVPVLRKTDLSNPSIACALAGLRISEQKAHETSEPV